MTLQNGDTGGSPLPDAASGRLVVTPAEISTVVEQPHGDLQPKRARRISLWLVGLCSIAAICLSALCLAAIAIRVVHRRAGFQVRHAWDSLLCNLLIVSGLIATMLFALIVTLFPRSASPVLPFALRALDLASFPAFPSAGALKPEQIASEGNLSTFVLTPGTNQGVTRDYLNAASIGAATLLMADATGFLFATSRHVVEGKGIFDLGLKHDQMLLISYSGAQALARIVGLNRDVDLAVIWTPRKAKGHSFCQPIASGDAISPGESIFVIGHPQRLFFTLSTGLISRAVDPNLIQFSAAISPGNSGGPVYDSFGNLLGVVSAMVDRSQNPNAENLNFAVRSDKLLIDGGWDYQDNGRAELNLLRESLAARRYHD